MKLTIYFESPYWVGLLEEERDGLLYVGRHVFGAEPSDAEVYVFVLHGLVNLQARMTVGVPVESIEKRRVNPKRMAREVRREVANEHLTSKAQEAMRLQLEANKVEQRRETRQHREALRDYKCAITRLKVKQEHRGR